MHNAIDFSYFKALRRDLPFKNFSVKYVVDGCENYTVNGRLYAVHAGQYLLANQFAEGFVEIQSPQMVKGICINLAPELLMEATASHLQPGSPQPDFALDRFFSTPAFLENKYSAHQTRAGQLLGQLEQTLANFSEQKPLSDPISLTQELCFDLAGRIVADHVLVYRQLQSIPSIKAATKKDLLRRVERGREYLDAHFWESLDIGAVAQASCLSEYHFFRLFKAVHGLSPYRYVLRKRLEKAVSRIQEGRLSIAEVAEETGFSDIHAFSKAFKNGFGLSPKAYFKSRQWPV